jgi:phosphoribosyl 1,2-cyclic phosphodiesterase
MKLMKITFIGTGAADYNWSRYGEPGILGSTATLIDDHLLLDCGPSVPAALTRYGKEYAQITDIVITHRHSDHFSPDSLKRITAGRIGEIRLFGPPQVCELAKPFCRVQVLDFGSRFQAAGYDFLTLPANHTVEDIFEKTFLYLISGAQRTLLYALDTAWLPTLAYRLLAKTPLDGVIWDATMSKPGDWRIFEHTDPVMFSMMRKTLASNGNIHEKTRIWFDHRARTLWPADPEEQESIARRENVELAREGETVIL